MVGLNKIIMRLLVVIFLFVNGLLFSQKYIYHTKTYSYRNETVEFPQWKRLPDKNMIIILNVDSMDIDGKVAVSRKVSIYSSIYQEYYLLKVNTFNKDDNGNYSIDFIAKDMWGNMCDFSYLGFKNKLILIIHYHQFSLKYVLKKHIKTSYYYQEQTNTTYD
jgi:hypothetical protein